MGDFAEQTVSAIREFDQGESVTSEELLKSPVN